LKYITLEQVARKVIRLSKGSLIANGMLPFGRRSAPKIFNTVADALEWCTAAEGVEYIYHYLDDFAVFGPTE